MQIFGRRSPPAAHVDQSSTQLVSLLEFTSSPATNYRRLRPPACATADSEHLCRALGAAM